MHKVQYEPVQTSDSVKVDKRPAARRPEDQWVEYIKNKVEAGVWVAAFLFTFDRSQIVKQLLTNPLVTKPFFWIFLACLGVNLTVTMFILYLTYVKGYNDYEHYSPTITPFATVAGVIGFFSLIVAIFPVYGFLSLVIVPVLGMGLLMFTSFIPFKGELSTFALFLLICLFGYVGYYWY